MTKQTKIFIFIFFIIVVLISFLIINSKIITIEEDKGDKIGEKVRQIVNKINKIDPIVLKNNYEEKLKIVFDEFEELLLQTKIESDDEKLETASSSLLATSSVSMSDIFNQASGLKIAMMELTVPEEYKELHLDLIMSFNKFKDFTISQKEEDRLVLTEMIDKIKIENEWLSSIK